jgi:hypothetical protein
METHFGTENIRSLERSTGPSAPGRWQADISTAESDGDESSTTVGSKEKNNEKE